MILDGLEIFLFAVMFGLATRVQPLGSWGSVPIVMPLGSEAHRCIQ
jgi:hypothetical protein